MAWIKSKTLDTGVAGEYWTIKEVSELRKGQWRCQFELYKDKDGYDSGLKPMGEELNYIFINENSLSYSQLNMSGKNPRKAIYSLTVDCSQNDSYFSDAVADI